MLKTFFIISLVFFGLAFLERQIRFIKFNRRKNKGINKYFDNPEKLSQFENLQFNEDFFGNNLSTIFGGIGLAFFVVFVVKFFGLG